MNPTANYLASRCTQSLFSPTQRNLAGLDVRDIICFALERYMANSEIIFSVQESPEGGYEARALGHAIHTQAESMDDLREAVRDAVRCHFDSESRPAVIRLHLVKDEVISA